MFVTLIVGGPNVSVTVGSAGPPDVVAGWSFEAHSVPHSANVSDSQQWKHSRWVRLLLPATVAKLCSTVAGAISVPASIASSPFPASSSFCI
ncbi:hypothetical protein HN51_061451 [Arachis hypogaea]